MAFGGKQKPFVVPIPGTTKLHRIEENLGSAAIEPTAGELREMADAAAKVLSSPTGSRVID